MKILLVNCYAHSETGDRKYRNFREILLKNLTEQDVNLEGKNYNLVERDKDHIDDYLFDLNSIYTKREAANDFDILDLVCIVGDINLLPWQKAAEKAVILIKMCLRVKKWFFAVGFAMHALIYLSASNLEKPIKVLNGNGHGSKIGELANVKVTSPDFNPTDFFLDHVTGDLYSYNPENQEWVPFTNIGLHYERAAHESNTIGKYVVKSPVYHPKQFNSSAQYNFTEANEKLCILKKHNYSHWLFDKISAEFTVPWKMRWDVHAFSFLDPSKVFSILAESKTGPVIIEYRNITAVQFEISKRYPDTVKIFQNFMASILQKLISNEPCQLISVYKYREIESRDKGFQGYVFKKNGLLKELRLDNAQFENTRGFKLHTSQESKQIHSRPVTVRNDYLTQTASLAMTPQKEFVHSGYASKNKGPQIVTQNVIVKTRVQASKKVEKEEGFYKKRLNELKEEFKKKWIYRKENANNSLDDKLHNPATHRARIEGRNNSMPKLAKNRMDSPNGGSKTETRVTLASPNASQGNVESQFEQTLFKGDIRKRLYPELNEEFIGEDKTWVPGNLSKHKEEPKKSVIKLTSTLYSSGIFPNKRKKLSGLEIKYPLESLIQSSPYVSAIDLARKNEQDEAKKILHGRVFVTSSKPSFNKNYSSRNSNRASLSQERVQSDGVMN